MFFRVLFVLLVGVVAGCATPVSPLAGAVQDASVAMVGGCEFIENVSGTSGVGGMAASTGIKNAKNEAREQAAKLGATHIVWRSVVGGYVPNVNGDAYRCE